MYADKEMMEYISSSIFAIEKNCRSLFKEVDLYCKNLSEINLLNTNIDRLTEGLKKVALFNSDFNKLRETVEQLNLYNENNERLNETIVELLKGLHRLDIFNTNAITLTQVLNSTLKYFKERENHKQQKIDKPKSDRKPRKKHK
jgi:hypothetical protein